MPFTKRKPFHATQIPSLTTAVQGEIERRILTGEIEAGERLSESALAEDFGVSRGPVREATRGLMQAGLVDIIANKGVVVRKIGMDEAKDLYDLRTTIFGYVCELLADRYNPEFCVALRDDMERMEEAVIDGDRETYYQHNVSFHSSIVEFAGNARARMVYESIAKEMHLYRRRGLSIVENMEQSLDEHRKIFEAIEEGDGDRARLAGVTHVRNGKARFFGTLDKAESEITDEKNQVTNEQKGI